MEANAFQNDLSEVLASDIFADTLYFFIVTVPNSQRTKHHSEAIQCQCVAIAVHVR